MDSAKISTILAAIIAGLVAVIGYLVNQYANRRDSRVRMYADALQAIVDFEELPFLIWRRPTLDGAALVNQTSKIWGRVRYYESILQLESPAVGAAYVNLANMTRMQGKQFRKAAWDNPARDAEFAHKPPASFHYSTTVQRDICLLAMRRELKPWGRVTRNLTIREINRTVTTH